MRHKQEKTERNSSWNGIFTCPAPDIAAISPNWIPDFFILSMRRSIASNHIATGEVT
jgi:hypothetical protein